MVCSSFPEAVAYIESLIPTSSKKLPPNSGIARMRSLLKKLGDPQNSFKSIHIAGTSGKGSTAYLIAKILEEHGIKVGLHTSPHLQTICERAIFNGALISPNEFTDLVNEIYPYILETLSEFKEHVTYYEALLAIAFLYFKRKGAEYGIIETGLGGTYDGTNVLNSLITVITKIGIDHTDILGNTIKEIASQKVGILKSENLACISQKHPPEAQGVLKKRIKKLGITLYLQGIDYNTHNEKITGNGSSFTYTDDICTIRDISLPLIGKYQIDNASAAIRTVLELKKMGLPINRDTIKKALAESYFPGRMEYLKLDNGWILDGAHNKDKLLAFISSLKLIYPKSNKVAIIGFKKGKDINTCLKIIIPYFNTIICTQTQTLNASGKSMSVEPDEIKRSLLQAGYNGTIIIKDQAKDAVKLAKKELTHNNMIIVTGSLYLVGEVRSLLGLNFSLSSFDKATKAQ